MGNELTSAMSGSKKSPLFEELGFATMLRKIFSDTITRKVEEKAHFIDHPL